MKESKYHFHNIKITSIKYNWPKIKLRPQPKFTYSTNEERDTYIKELSVNRWSIETYLDSCFPYIHQSQISMKKKYTKEKFEIMKEHQLPDSEFLGRCAEILQMEVTKRCSSHDSPTEEELSLYATDEQWKKHPLMYELIMGDGLGDEEFDIAMSQPFYVDDMTFRVERTNKGEVKVSRIK